MTASPDILPRGWHVLRPADAEFMGRLCAAGLAMPNEPHLSQPAETVADVTDPFVQKEIDRLVDAMHNVNTIPGLNAVGMAHSQLQTTPECPKPLRIVLVPEGVAPGQAPNEMPAPDFALQCLLNATYAAPRPGQPTTNKKEGCLSLQVLAAVTRRMLVVSGLQALNRFGEEVQAEEVGDYPAIVLQHEVDHTNGRRAVETPGSPKLWVGRDRKHAFDLIPTGKARGWTHKAKDAQWKAFGSDPEYTYLHTTELQDAFATGYAMQQQANVA